MPRNGQEKNKIVAGMTFGRLTVVSVAEIRKVACLCSCGRTTQTNKYDLLYGRTVSCGCYSLEMSKKRIEKVNWSHGKSGTYEHKHWWQMVRRCTDRSFTLYEKYGGSGILISKQWVGTGGFVNFLDHIGESPSKRHTIDRVDNSGSYIPGNVRWATPKEQSRNRSTTIMISAFGRTQCIQDWADEMKIGHSTIQRRLAGGWDHELAVSAPARSVKTVKSDARIITAFGRSQHLAAWAKETGINRKTITSRIRSGKSPEDALTPSKRK